MNEVSKNNNTWKRRKSRNVKPNFIVRSIYNTVDWFGEFSGIVDSVKRRTGYTLVVTLSTLITLSILVSSTVHSVALLEWAGLTGGLQFVMLLPFEILFLVSSNALNKSILQGKWFPLAPWAGFLVSLAFVLRSNLLGMANNPDGQALAWLTPVLLLISKGLLGWYVKNGNMKTEQITSVKKRLARHVTSQLEVTNKLTSNSTDFLTKEVTSNQPKKLVKPTDDLTEFLTETSPDQEQNELLEVTSEVTKIPEDKQEPSSDLSEKSTKKSEHFSTEDEPSMTKSLVEEQLIDDTTKPIEDQSVEQAEATEKADEKQPMNDAKNLVENQLVEHEKATEKVNENQSENQSKNILDLVEEITKNIPSKSQERKKKITKATKMALTMYKKQGKKPTIDELMKKANCSQNIAKDVLKEVKQRIPQAS